MNTHDILNDNVLAESRSSKIDGGNLGVDNSNQNVGGTPSPTGYRDYKPPTEVLDNDYNDGSSCFITQDFRDVSSSRKDREIKSSDVTHKTILLGDSGVGKTSLLVQFDTGTFQPRNFAATVGIGFTNKIVTVDDTQVKLQIWDTAGQERFRSVTHAYYRDAHGNKSDCEKERVVRQEEGERLAREYKVPFMETSAKTGLNVELAFLTVARHLIHGAARDVGTNNRDNKFNVQDFMNEKSHHISCASSYSGCLT